MGLEEEVLREQHSEMETCRAWTLSVHAFSDLTYISPVVFIYLLKECYIHGISFFHPQPLLLFSRIMLFSFSLALL